MKPGDVYVGVIDFFSSVIPGAIAAFMLMTSGWIPPPRCWPPLEWGSPEGWVVFLVAAYLLGHLVSAIGSTLLDSLYDKFYAKWKRTRSDYQRDKEQRIQQQREERRELPTFPGDLFRVAWDCLIGIYSFVIDYSRDRLVCAIWAKRYKCKDGLLMAAETLKSSQLRALTRAARLEPTHIGNAFQWAETVVRLKYSEGITQAESLMAQSKLFRGVTVLIPFGLLWLGRRELIVWGVGVALLCLWRFLSLRWKATETLYGYFIAASLPERDNPARR